MKYLYQKLTAALLLLFLGFSVKAVNDSTLTIGQVFNWRAGDTLVYDYFQIVNFPNPPYGSGTVNQHGHNGFAVEARNNFPDTVIFHIRWKNGYADTITITNLDTLATKFSYSVLYPHLNSNACPGLAEIPTCDSSWSNYTFNYADTPIDTFASLWISFPQFESNSSISFTERIGLRHAGMGALEYWPNPGGSQGYSGGCGIKLVYFKSDSLTWVDPDYYLGITEQTPSPTFRLYPNPATDEITITTQTDAPIDVFVYDMLGNCVLSHKNFRPNLGNLKVTSLTPGYYVPKLTDQHGLASSKGFIIAR